MNSLETLKQELILQKNILDEKGFIVNTQNTHPSPNEITETLNNMDINFSVADALPEDVKAGKTFFAGSNGLKTGTMDAKEMDNLKDLINCFITGTGSFEINIPTGSAYTQIRDSAFKTSEKAPDTFYKHNLTIPDNITAIGNNSFQYTYLTGKLTIPSSCTKIGEYAFERSSITEFECHSGMTSSSHYMLANCPTVERIILHAPITATANYQFANAHALKEIYLPSTLKNLGSTSFYNSAGIEMVEFTGDVPPTPYYASTFKVGAIFCVPYLKFDDYWNATNYQSNSRVMFGVGTFNEGYLLPANDEANLYDITWYGSFDDAKNQVNPITLASHTGKMYARFAEIETT